MLSSATTQWLLYKVCVKQGEREREKQGEREGREGEREREKERGEREIKT